MARHLVDLTIRRININYLTTDASGVDAAEIICKNNTSSDMAHWTEYTAAGAATWPTDFDYQTQGGPYLKTGTQVYNNETYLWIFGQRESSSEGYYRNFNATTFTWGSRYRDPSGISHTGSDEVINNIQDGNDIYIFNTRGDSSYEWNVGTRPSYWRSSGSRHEMRKFTLHTNPANDGTWTTLADIPTPRHAMKCCLVGKKIFTFGGFHWPIFYGNPTSATYYGITQSDSVQCHVIEVYDIITNSWTTNNPTAGSLRRANYDTDLPSLASEPMKDMWGATCVTKGDDIYFIYNPSINTATPYVTSDVHIVKIFTTKKQTEISNSIQIYDPSYNRYDTSLNTMPTPRADGVTVVEGTKIYTIGGVDASSNKSDVVEIFDTADNSWTSSKIDSSGVSFISNLAMPTARSGMAGTIFEYPIIDTSYGANYRNPLRVAVLGGNDASDNQLTTVEILDLSNNTWSSSDSSTSVYTSKITPFTSGVSKCSAQSDSSGNVYIFDISSIQLYVPTHYNFVVDNSLTGWSDTVQRYDPVTDTWTTNLTPMPSKRGLGASAITTDWWKIWTIGGQGVDLSNNDYSDYVEYYDTVTNTWTRDELRGGTISVLPTPRKALTATAYNYDIFIVGGKDTSGNHSNVLEIYNTTTNKWKSSSSLVDKYIYFSNVPAMPTGRQYITSVLCGEKIHVMGGGTITDGSGSTTVEILTPPLESTTIIGPTGPQGLPAYATLTGATGTTGDNRGGPVLQDQQD